VTNNSVDQENIPIAVLVYCTIVILDKMVQPSYIYTFICVSRFADRNKLVSSYIIIEPRCYYPDTRYNNNRGNSIPICRDILYYSNRETFSGILVYISLILIKTTISSPAGIQTRALFLFILCINLL
jgi:hypothetical protein